MNVLEESFLNARRFALGIVFGQMGLALLAGLVCLLLEGSKAGMSALTGGAIGAVASFCMVVNTFRFGPPVEPVKVLRGIYRGEFFKLALTAALFALAFRFLEVSFGPMIGGFAATFVVYWVVLGLRLPSSAAVSEH